MAVGRRKERVTKRRQYY